MVVVRGVVLVENLDIHFVDDILLPFCVVENFLYFVVGAFVVIGVEGEVEEAIVVFEVVIIGNVVVNVVEDDVASVVVVVDCCVISSVESVVFSGFVDEYNVVFNLDKGNGMLFVDWMLIVGIVAAELESLESEP